MMLREKSNEMKGKNQAKIATNYFTTGLNMSFMMTHTRYIMCVRVFRAYNVLRDIYVQENLIELNCLSCQNCIRLGICLSFALVACKSNNGANTPPNNFIH